MAQGSRRNRSAQSASFFWQAVFILLPVAILAGIGIFTLKRDRAFAEQEARERANGLAEEALERLMAALGLMVQSNSAVLSHDFTAMGQEGLVMDAGGNLLSPKILEPASFAQLVDWESLSPGQRKLWREAEILEFAKGDYPEAAKLQQEFLESQPSADWSARGRYTLGLLLLKQGQTNGATEQFQLARDGSSASPTLVQHLAQLQLIHLGASGENPSVQPGRIEERILWHAAYQPSMASRDLLLAADRSGLKPSKAEYKSWAEVWEATETQRALYRSLIQNEGPAQLTSGPAWRWTAEASPRLLQRQESGKGIYAVRCMGEERVLQMAEAAFAAMKGLPPYFGFSCAVAGREIIPAKSLRPLIRTSKGKAGGLGWSETEPQAAPERLGAATRLENGQALLGIGVHLLSPQMLYERVENRRYGFLALIGVSVAAALLGFFTARRAFLQQLRLSELKTNFVSSVSHELRAPVASLRLMAERLESGRVENSAQRKEYFHFIVQECRRLGTMIENVLDFSRIERGRKQYEFEPTDLVALVGNSVKLMEPGAAERNITLEQRIQGTAVPVSGDGLALQQVMLNLIDNAIKHSPSGSRVEVGISFPEQRTPLEQQRNSEPHRVTEANRVQMWVMDQGEGIPKVEHEKIFERFYRCGSELRRTTQGVGIGLSIVKHVVEAHRGRVVVESEPRQGSRFTVELPINESDSHP